MIYFITVHYNSAKWIDVQSHFIQKNINEPYRIYACLNGVANKEYDKFYYADDIMGTHAVKLNTLASRIITHADDDDILIFIDGDAFPVSDKIVLYVKDKIQKYQLVAIRRNENLGDIQPHPSFCATTVGLWKAIKGDWMPGYEWTNEHNNKITSIGGNLLKILSDNKVMWYAMLRSNKKNLHPLWFGIYDDIVYHHGAGFRSPVSRVDLAACPLVIAKKLRRNELDLPDWCKPVTRTIGGGLVNLWCAKNYVLSRKIYKRICTDDTFHTLFIE